MKQNKHVWIVSIQDCQVMDCIGFTTENTMYIRKLGGDDAEKYMFIEDITRRIVFYQEKKIISSSHRVSFFLLHRQEYFCTNNSVK